MDLKEAIRAYVFSLILMNKIPMTQERLYWLRSRAESAYQYELAGKRVDITPDLSQRSIFVDIV
ncbi:hypothetical protein QGX11_gp057 [Pseudomonas phage PPSC2]|uniref:Uncharacterized protein n=1 Tax=Pseudomonas phage PPSC2 TaxID=2041350 RepID=A0A2R2YAU5_9CAUD|nr:hypothetical protein QGX11_gp057 [Pseudomonas phage PPSC2]ATN92820.1 hypothetical protein PPSC2_57 [Pseudomonas phage PPSC2]